MDNKEEMSVSFCESVWDRLTTLEDYYEKLAAQYLRLDLKIEKMEHDYEREKIGFPYIGDSVYVVEANLYEGGYSFGVSFIQSLTPEKFKSDWYQKNKKAGYFFSDEEYAKRYADELNAKMNAR